MSETRKTVLHNPFALSDYFLDEASLVVAGALEPFAGMRMADLCASPGGKSLASIFAVAGDGEWHCNDLSPTRVKRLKAVLRDYLPPEILVRIRVTTGDATRFGLRYKSVFDRVLVDAPCSGERHLLASKAELERWSEKGSKRLAVRQHALVCAGLDSLKPGGLLVYSTCTISPHENDAVIDKLFKSRVGRFAVETAKQSVGEPTRHGRLILPDREGCGPMYYAVLRALS